MTARHALGLALLLIASVPTGAQEKDKKGASDPAHLLPPSWSQTLPAAERFVVLENMNGTAVLDKETGLVWQRSPLSGPVNWWTAMSTCNMNLLGLQVVRFGWRLPTIQELSSLVVRVEFGFHGLPPGHPFDVDPASPGRYWSSTSSALVPDDAYTVDFAPSAFAFNVASKGASAPIRVWCVRGGLGG